MPQKPQPQPQTHRIQHRQSKHSPKVGPHLVVHPVKKNQGLLEKGIRDRPENQPVKRRAVPQEKESQERNQQKTWEPVKKKDRNIRDVLFARTGDEVIQLSLQSRRQSGFFGKRKTILQGQQIVPHDRLQSPPVLRQLILKFRQ